ncbi:MAG: metallophosphatase family protein [Anaerolineaceae bacterium]|nr:metallophosphatase family protein [Anaerolineaceae bacterium]
MPQKSSESSGIILTVGVVSDTHIPDRVRNLHPGVIPTLKSKAVDLILHAGDVSTQSVIDDLEQVAPLMMVRGNRDLVFLKRQPVFRRLELAGTQVVLLHGHGGVFRYFWDKFRNVFDGYRLGRYLPVLLQHAPNAKVYIFGHTHYPENIWIDGKLIFNPGSAGGGGPGLLPSIGVLKFKNNGQVLGEIIFLDGSYKKFRRWFPEC